MRFGRRRHEQRRILILDTLRRADVGMRGLEIAGVTQINPGAMYPALITLENDEFVCSHWGDNGRRVYHITEAGILETEVLTRR